MAAPACGVSAESAVAALEHADLLVAEAVHSDYATRVDLNVLFGVDAQRGAECDGDGALVAAQELPLGSLAEPQGLNQNRPLLGVVPYAEARTAGVTPTVQFGFRDATGGAQYVLYDAGQDHGWIGIATILYHGSAPSVNNKAA